jgi:hypothetical protein
MSCPEVNYDAIVASIWREHAKRLQELLDKQNEALYKIAKERDELLLERTKEKK